MSAILTDNDFLKLAERVASTINQHKCWVTEMAHVTGASNRWTPHGSVQLIYLDCGCELEVPVDNRMILMADIRDWQDQVRNVALQHEHVPGTPVRTIRVEPYSPAAAQPTQAQLVATVLAPVQLKPPPQPMGFKASVPAVQAPVAPAPAPKKEPEIKKDRFELLDLDD